MVRHALVSRISTQYGAETSPDPVAPHPAPRYLRAHGIRVVDEDPVKSTILIPGIESFRGAVLMNHRSWGDFGVDPYQGHCACVGRLEAFLAMGLAGMLGLLSNRAIIIQRGKTSRGVLRAMCAKHDRYLVYPEATRRAAQPNADEAIPLQGVGGLKNIWEDRALALIVITGIYTYIHIHILFSPNKDLEQPHVLSLLTSSGRSFVNTSPVLYP